MPEMLQVESLLSVADRFRGLRIWLVSAAFYYPLFWLSFSIVWAGPSLIVAALRRSRLDYFRLRPFGLEAGVAGGGLSLSRHNHLISQWVTVLVPVLAVLVAVVVALLLARRERLLSGLFVATSGNAALGFTLAPLFFFHRAVSPAMAVAGCFYFGILYVGLRRMLAGGWATDPEARYAGRFGFLLSAFLAPPLLLVLGFLGLRLSREFLLLTVPGLVGAALASLRPARPARRWHAGCPVVGLGVAASLVLLMGVREGARAWERARQAGVQKLLAAYPPPDPNAPYPRLFFQRGVNFTVEGPGGYASDEVRQVLASLPSYGVNAVALVPYGFTRPGKSPTIGFGGWETDDMMRVGARLAHARGMKVMLKPAIWDAITLEFSSPDARRQWFRTYQSYIEHYARLAKEIHADIFCIGGEFAHLTPYDAPWRGLIAQVRQIYPGPLVYAANFGQEFESITFWDALDYIGLQEYYPLPDSLDAGSVVARVEAVQRKFRRPVIFTEVGFTSTQGANHEPWDDSEAARVSPEEQAECYQAVFRAFYHRPWFRGMYWWKVGTDGGGGPEDGSFTPLHKPAMEVIRQWYVQGGR